MSICTSCGQDIVWIKRPGSESYFPPFEGSDALDRMDYEVKWDEERGDWVAAPLDRDLTIKLARHDCAERRARVAEDRAEREFRREQRGRERDAARKALEEHGVSPLIAAMAVVRPSDVDVDVEQDPPPQPAVVPRTVYVEKWRDPRPEQYIKMARRVAVACPTCGAVPFEWCTYKLDPATPTQQLHTARVWASGRQGG